MNEPHEKWVLVTGAARRIGRVIALELAAHGWNIIVHYHHSAEDAASLADEIIAKGRKAVLAEIDLANADLAIRLIPSLAKELGPITALINNASIFEPDSRDADGRLHWAINTEAPRLLSEALAQQLPEQQQGVIVNILDGVPAEKDFTAYLKSKQALAAQTLQLAKQFAPRVRMNGIAPGPVLINERQSQQHFQGQIDRTLLKTGITPQDIASAALFLLNASAITGDVLHVNNGALLA